MTPELVVLHCSASLYGTADLIDDWHRDRGFRRRDPRGGLPHIGYHYVILSGAGSSPRYDYRDDGRIVIGRREDEIGAHCRGLNTRSIGICLVGHPYAGTEYTDSQLASLDVLCCALLDRYNLTVDHVIGHYEAPSQMGLGVSARKTCPEIDMITWRERFALTYDAYLRSRA